MRTVRQGFTTLDVLVASVLVILLTGMLLPAAQEVKEAEKRKRCINNLKQLGLAAHNYQSAYAKLPPGWLGPLANESSPKFDLFQNLSVLTYLLPFMEQDHVYRNLLAAAPADFLNIHVQRQAWYANDQLLKTAGARIEALLCPSAPDMFRATDGVIVGVHFANTPKGLVQPPMHFLPPKEPAFEKLGRTNYFGVAGMYGRGSNTKFPGTRSGMARFEGVFTNRSQVSIDQITSSDGTSNTLMFVEGTGGSHDWQSDKPGARKPVQYGASWMGFGALPTAGGLANHGEPSLWYQFSSTHDGIVNFCFADGTVRALRTAKTATTLYPKLIIPDEPREADKASAYWILQELAGVRDGGLRPLDLLVVRERP